MLLWMMPNTHCAHGIVFARQLQLPPLPTLPLNARYLRHPNRCYDWGTIGWVLSSKQVDIKLYK